MWLSRTIDGLYFAHKNEPKRLAEFGMWSCGSHAEENISEWLAVELCDKHNECRPTYETGPIELFTHKARLYSYHWWLLLTREWEDLKKCLK